MSIITANINFLASLGITTSEQFTAAFGDMASFTEYCTAIGYSWELDENNDIILITPDGKKVNTYIPTEESEKTATPEIVVTPGDTEYTFEAIGDGDVKLYIDEVEVSNPVAISRTNEAQEVTVTATAQEQGKQISDEAWEEVTIPALSGPSSISFETDHFTIQGPERGTIESPELVVITDDLGNDVTEYCNFTFDPDDKDIHADQNSGSPIYSNGSSPAGTYSVEMTADYNGLTATATVDVDITAPSSISFDQNSYPGDEIPEGQHSAVAFFSVTDDLGNEVTYDCTYSFSPNTTSLYVDGSQFCVADSDPAGTYSVDVTATYEGLTATATVDFEITSPVQVPNYMKLTVLDEPGNDGEIVITIPQNISSGPNMYFGYSKDGTNWTNTAIDGITKNIRISVNAGDGVYLKSYNNGLGSASSGGSTSIKANVRLNASGNIMSLLYGDNFENQTTLPCGYALSYLFQPYYAVDPISGQTHYISSIVDASQLELPATTLNTRCYEYMFSGCDTLTTAPALPATALSTGCYYCMFGGCYNLTTAPVLPATILTSSCYRYMFQGCSSLNSITMLATNISASSCLNNWVQNVASGGTFTKSPNMTTLPTGDSGIPTGWTVVDYVDPSTLSQQISSILGQDVDIINDMSEQDALDAALDILGTNE